MRKPVAACIAGFVAACAVPLFAQSATTDTLTALLTEVRLLRQALERSAAAPQIQLLGTRLAVQNERVQSATRDHEAAREALQKVTEEIGEMTARLQSITEELDRGTANPQAQRQFQDLQTTLKMQLATLNGREAQLRARESELASAVASEQNEWLLLNRRLDEFEKTLAR
jgi:chromosome segregation ATPase